MQSVNDHNAHSYDERAKQWEAAMPQKFGHIYLEKPAMLKELPDDLSGKLILCVGVGSGEELEEILKRNPKHVTAIDISEELLVIAKQKYPTVDFKEMDMMGMTFSDELFDLIYSSLAFHYSNDWDTLLEGMHRILKRGGELLFSTHHPGYWSKKPMTGKTYTNGRDTTLTEHTDILPVGVSIIFYNHPNESSILDSVTHSGFKVLNSFTPSVVEVSDIPCESHKNYESLKEKNANTPLFLVVHAVKE